MTQTLKWAPIVDGFVVGKVEVIDILLKLWDSIPATVDRSHLADLDAAMRLSGGEVATRLQKLINAIEDNGAIRLWVEY